MQHPLSPALQRYVSFFETLSPATLSGVRDMFCPDARFKDPFNDVQGHDRIIGVFQDMFETVGQPSFKVTDTAWGLNLANTAYLRWTFSFRIQGKGREMEVGGMSEVTFDAAGRIKSHIDYWDAASGLYEKLPLIGFVLRRLRAHISAGG